MPIPSPAEWLATEAPDVNGLVDQAAARHGVDPHLAHSVMQVESGGRTDAVSPAGAIGAMQLMPGTARDLGVDPHDPAQNIEGGVKLLRQLTDHYGGDFNKAAAAYNAGQGAVDRAGGVPKIPETQDYVKKIQERLEQRLKDPKNFPAMISPPNIPLRDRPVVKNPDGTSSTVSTITIESDGKGVLLPTIIGGKRVTADEAVDHWRKTGESLGVFKTEADANEYDKRLHTLMGWNGAPGSGQAAWQASAQPAAAAVKHGPPSPAEWLDDPLNADTSDPSKLPAAEHFNQAHQTFLERAKATFNQGVDAVKGAIADPSSLFQKPMQVPASSPDSTAGRIRNELTQPGGAADRLEQTVKEHGIFRPLQDALRPPVQYDEPQPTTTAGKVAQGVGSGITRTAESLTTPENIALMVGTEGLGLLPKIGKLLPRTLSGYFSASMFKSAYDQSPKVRQAIEKGDVKGAAEGITELVATVGLAGLAGHHAVAGEGVPRGTSEAPELPKTAETAESGATGENTQLASGKQERQTGKQKVPSPADWLAGETNGPRISGQQYLEGKAGGAEPTTPAAESAKVFEQHGKTYAELFEDLSDKDKQREASAAGAANKPARATVPAEGAPEGVARALDARERLAQDLTKKPFRELNNPDRNAIDELISEGFGQAAQPKKGFRARELEGAGPDLLEGSGPADVVRMPRPKAAEPAKVAQSSQPIDFRGSQSSPRLEAGPRGTDEQPLATEVMRPGTEAPAMNAAAETEAAADAGANRRKAAGFPNWQSEGALALKPDRGELEGKHVAQMIDRGQTLKPEIAEKLAPGSTRVNARGGVETLAEVPIDKIREAPPTADRPQGNVMYPEVVEKYRATPSPVAPELRATNDGQFQIYEGHHRIAGAIARGDKSVLAWTSESGPDGFPKATGPRPNYSVERGHFVVHEETGAPAMRVPLSNPDSVKGASFLLRHMGEDAIADQLEAAGGLKEREIYKGHAAAQMNEGGLKPGEKTGSEPAKPKEAEPVTPERQPVVDKVARELTAEPAGGKATRVKIPGGQAAYPAKYAIREQADVRPSHNPFSFGKNPEFEHANDRDYEAAGNAARVVEQAKNFDPDFLTTDSPTAENGAPVIDKRGNVLGGNSRAMTLARVYDEGGDHAAAYRKSLADKAESLGIDPKELARFKEPVLVRELVGSHDAAKAITDFNKKGPAELSPEERAVSDGRRMSADTIADLAGRMGEAVEGGTLAEALRGEDGAKVVNRLVKDGVFTQQEANGLIDDRGHLTAEAKSRIAKALVGRLFNTPAEFRQAPPALRAKLERIAPQVLRVEGRKDWSLTRLVREAVGIAEEMRAHKSRAEDLERQVDLEGKQRDHTPAAVQIAEVLNESQRNAEYAFRRYANDEQLSRPGAQKPLYEPPTREQAFRDAFGGDHFEPITTKAPTLRMTGDRTSWLTGQDDAYHANRAAYEQIKLDPADGEHSLGYVTNPSGIELVYRLGYTGQIPNDYGGKNVGGFHIARSIIPALLQRITGKADAKVAQFAGYSQLRNMLKAAEAADKGLAVVSDFLGASDRSRQRALDEELNHGRQSALNQGRHVSSYHGTATESAVNNDPVARNKFLMDPLADRAKRALASHGDGGASGGLYSKMPPGQAMAEIGVRLMDRDRFEELGLNFWEARTLAARYVRALREVYGNTPPREIARKVFDAQEWRAAVPKPRAESASSGSEGRGGPESGARADLSGSGREAGTTARDAARSPADVDKQAIDNVTAKPWSTIADQMPRTRGQAFHDYADAVFDLVERGELQEGRRGGTFVFGPKGAEMPADVRPPDYKPKSATDTKILDRIPGENGTEAVIAKVKDGYSVIVRDTDADQAFSAGARIFDTEQKARDYADTIKGKQAEADRIKRGKAEDAQPKSPRLADAEGQGGLFRDDSEIARAKERDAALLTKKRLEAQLNAPIGPGEQKLKRDKTKRQGGLFDGPADEAQQGSLFDASIIGARERRPGETLSTWRDRMEEHVGKLNTGDAVKLYAAAGRMLDDTSGRLDFGAIARKFRDGQLFNSMYDTVKPLGSRVAQEGNGAGASLMKLIARAGDKGEVHAGQMLARLADARINDLDRGQRAELLDQLEGRAKSSDPRVLEVARVMRGITDELAGTAAATGVEVRTKNGRRPFAQLEDYFPHVLRNAEALSSGPVRRDVIDNIVRQGIQPDKAAAGSFVDDWVQYLQLGKRADSILQHLVDSGQVKDKAEALAKLQRFRSNIQRHGSLEYARELNLPFYDPDPVRVLPFAAASGAKRLAQISEFGQDHQRINQEILKIAEGGGNADFARKSIDKMLGVITEGDTAEARVSRLLRAAQTMKLGLSAIPNATQGVLNSMLAADAPTVAAGFISALSSRGKRLAIESGAAIEPVLAEAHKELGGGRMVDKYLKYTGFSQTEQFNRATAANVGAKWAKKNLSILMDSPKNAGARARLEELGVDVDKAIARGSLTQDERLMAAKKFSDLTQFRTRPEDLPAFASTPLGRVAFQFKNFAYNQARLIAKETVGEIREGRVGRGLRTAFVIATLFPAAGELVRLLRNGITGREQDFESDVEHYFTALSSAGTLGILQDAITSAQSGKSLEFLAGPAAGDLANLGNIIGDKDTDVGEKLQALRKYAAQRYAGPARRLFDTE